MIAIVGIPAWRNAEPAGPAGRSCEIAIAASERGARVELVGRVGDDGAGDALMIALARAGVGHAAILRDPTQPTAVVAGLPDGEGEALAEAPAPPALPMFAAGPRLEPADVELGLGYLTEFRVLVVADDVPADTLQATIDAAAFASAHLVLLVPPARPVPPQVPPDATVLAAPDEADDGAFGALVGAYAAALDAGEDPAEAFAAALGGSWSAPVPEDTTY